ncbi:MAG: hypothetical protein H0U64_10260 [Gemmatimonadaceae bacterium]|nr:hypothetical protein [Gemmatimonadaceae bacterium]
MLIRPRWRLLFVPSRDGAENMARDVALQDHSRKTGECVLSVYTWIRPTLSFGRNQTAKGLYDLERIASEKLDVVRRPTGGRAILHHREFTYSVTGIDAFAPTLPAAYDRVNALLLLGMNNLGVSVAVASPTHSAPKPDQSPCFAEPVKGELVVAGRKLVGSAQYRENGAFLQHGSILVENDQHLLRAMSLDGSPEEFSAPATLTELVSEPITASQMANVLFDAVRTLEDQDASPMDESDIRTEALAHREHFTDPLWTWRR